MSPVSKRPLRILQLNSARKFVGEAAHTLNLTEALRRAGHHVVLGLRRDFDTHRAALERGLEPVGFRMPSRWWPPSDLADLRQILRIVRSEQIDLIHAHRGKDHWQAILASRLLGLRIPIVRTRHVVTPLRNHPGNRWQARHTVRLIAVSQAILELIRGSGLYSAGRVAFIPGGVDLERFARPGRRAETRARLNLAEEDPTAICVARLAAVKAHRVLIEAWKTVRQRIPRARLILVGGGRFEREVAEQIRSSGLQEGVLCCGRVPNEELPLLLEAADVGTLASVGSEGFSRAVLEYLALGLPVVATRVGAIPDLVEEGRSGRLVAPEDPTGLAEALLEVLALDPAQRSRWGAAARQRAETAHGYAVWAGAHERLYREALGANGFDDQ